ncbi:DUF7342 family protein [Natronomonas salsuginis]|uniref:ArsR family transcriptional regulator n=1 Tax=Natronomonas salsuginis TaxID=2217661 RepID=A0A4U5JGA2_9EURY|nr:ArsR family transcriptional regulator [Natronomonas salsuginis]TKR25089.1 ArsR family transcriptional regulator [Natronomonas salsuginis]
MADSEPGTEAWRKHASAFDRVQAVSQSLSTPRSASWIAAEASVSERTAREHLNRLVKMTVLLEFNNKGTKAYAADPIYQRFQVVRELLDEHDSDGLLDLKENLYAQIEAWQKEYEVNSPEGLREHATRIDNTERTTEIRRTAAEWDITEYRLDVVEDVIDNYVTYM